MDLAFPFTLRTEGFRDNPRRFAVLHGPLVLCAEVDAGQPRPAIVAEPNQTLASLKPVADKPSTFTGSATVFRVAGQQDGSGVTLEPFYKMHGQRHYEVYPLSEKLTQGKTQVTVKFQSHPGNTAGGVFGLRVLRRE